MSLATRIYEVCRLCIRYIKDDSQTLIDTYVLTPENITLKNFLTKCMPEIDLNRTVQRYVCGGCLANLKAIYNYKCKIRSTEDQISKYCSDHKLPNRTRVDLSCLMKADQQLENIASKIDTTYQSLMSLDGIKSEARNGICHEQTIYKCFMCDFASTEYASLKDHYRLIHRKVIDIKIDDLPPKTSTPGVEKHPCVYPGCAFSGDKHYKLLSHISTHLKNYVCDKCGERSSGPTTIATHMKHHEEANIAIKCYMCGFKCTDYNLARRHYFQKHKDVDLLEELGLKVDRNGNDCDIKALSDDLSMMLDSFAPDELSENIMAIDTKPEEPNDRYKCKECPYVGRSLVHIVNHETYVHSKKRRRNSNTSAETHDSSMTSKSGTNTTKKWKVETKKSEDSKPSSKSKQSPKPLPKLIIKTKKLEKEKSKTTESQPRKKSEVSKPKESMSKPTSSKNNVKKINSKLAFACSYCIGRFPTVEKFLEHYKKHHTGKTMYFKCGFCASTTLFKKNLKHHHSKLHSFVWKPPQPESPLSNKKAAKANRKLIEKKIRVRRSKIVIKEDRERIGYGKFNCLQCPYSAEQYKKFVYHLATHRKPFACAACQFQNSEVRGVRNHISSHHLGAAIHISCVFCRYSSLDSQAITRHFTEEHRYSQEFLGEFYGSYLRIKRLQEEQNQLEKQQLLQSKAAAKEQAVKKSPSVAKNNGGGSGGDSGSGSRSLESPTAPVASDIKSIKADTISTSELPTSVKSIKFEEVYCKAEQAVTSDNEDTDVDIISIRDTNDKTEKVDGAADPVGAPTIFACSICCQKFDSLKEFDAHIKTHDDTPLAKCCFCNFDTSRKGDLRKHYVSEHQLSFQDTTVDDKEALQTSLGLKGDAPIDDGEIIEIQDDVFSESLDDHIDNEMPMCGETGGEQIHFCNLCPYTTLNKDDLSLHHKEHSNKPFACIKCEESFADRVLLVGHLEIHKEEHTNQNENNLSDNEELDHDSLLATVKYSCDRCCFRTVDDEKMKLHHQKCKRKIADTERLSRFMNSNNSGNSEMPKLKPVDMPKSASPVDQSHAEKVLSSTENHNSSHDFSPEGNKETESECNAKTADMQIDEDKMVANLEKIASSEGNDALVAIKMVDPFESDSEDVCGSLEDAFATINKSASSNVTVKDEVKDKLNDSFGSNSSKDTQILDDCVVIDDDDDDDDEK